MSKSRNFLNEGHINLYAEDLVKDMEESHPHVHKWFTTTFRRWLKNESPCVKSVRGLDFYDDPIVQALKWAGDAAFKRLDRLVHMVDEETLPEWAVHPFYRNKLHYFVIPAASQQGMFYEEGTKYEHWRDYMRAESDDRPIHMSVVELIPKVAAWDKRLRSEKIKRDLEVGTRMVFRHNNPDHSWYVTQLLSKAAYDAEGAVMDHCVGSYYGGSTSIFSLRDEELICPLVTIEVNGKRIVQAKGYKNRAPTAEEIVVIKEWATVMSYEYTLDKPRRSLVDDIRGLQLAAPLGFGRAFTVAELRQFNGAGVQDIQVRSDGTLLVNGRLASVSPVTGVIAFLDSPATEEVGDTHTLQVDVRVGIQENLNLRNVADLNRPDVANVLVNRPKSGVLQRMIDSLFFPKGSKPSN